MHRQLGTVLALVILRCFLASPSSYTHYRLPTSIQPDRYTLKIITHLEDPANMTFSGQVSIHFKVLEDTSNITLHAQNLAIHDTRIILKSDSANKYMMCGTGIDTVPEQDYYIIRLCEPLHKGEMYKLKLYFSGILNDQLYGYYRSSYVVKGTNERRWLSVTQFEPAYARAAFPCLDEPIYKAKFKVWLGHHKSMTALSNMPLEEQIPLKGADNFVWSIFEESVPMSTYLVAYTVNDFSYKSSKQEEGSKVAFRIWSRIDDIDQCDYAAEVGPKILKYYEDIFGLPFPLPKVDVIGIPDFRSDAMENWGLITYSESHLLFAPNVSSEAHKQRISYVMAHELAHQWFGNLVTMKWWSDLWLNEGFATYVGSLGVHNLRPEWNSYNAYCLNSMLDILRTDAQLSSHPISQPIFNASQTSEKFDLIPYNKGSVVLRMVHMLLSQDGFFEAVREYLKTHAYKNAEQDDLWAAFTKKAHKYSRIEPQYDMKVIMDSWTLQTGYPLVKVNRDYGTGSVEITQHRYLENSDIPEEEANKCWWVPLSYTTASKSDFMATSPKAWLECDKSGKSFTLKLDNVAKANEWIMFNIQLSGVYRVMYDTENWRLLKEALNSDKFTSIHVMNRVQLIDDAIWLAWSGHHDYNVTFDILDYLIQEREYLPWLYALEGLGSVDILLKPFERLHNYFKAYMRYIIEPMYNYIDGLNDTVGDSKDMHNHLSHKSLVADWACKWELEDCVKSAINYFRQWKESENPDTMNIIPIDLRSVVYCTAIRHGDTGDWQFLWQRFKKVDHLEKCRILEALAFSRNDAILRDYIDILFDKKVHMHEEYAEYAFSFIGRNEAGASLARDYYTEHISDLYEFFRNNVIAWGDLLLSLASQIVSSVDLIKFSNFIDTHKNYFSKPQNNIQSALGKIDVNIKWIGNNVQAMESRLKSRLSLMGVLKEQIPNMR